MHEIILGAIIGALIGIEIITLLNVRRLIKMDHINDSIFANLHDIIKLQDKQITDLQEKVECINKYIHEVL